MTTLDADRRPTTTTTASATVSASTRSDGAGPLRLVLRLNATSSGVLGAAMAIAPHAIDDVLDSGRPGWVRLIGVALLPFAAAVAWLSTRSVRHLRTVTPGVIVGDIGWVAASVITVLFGWYSTAGSVGVLAVAAMVELWAVLQWRTWRRLPTS